MDTLTVTAGDGRTIYLYRWQPASQARGVILISHGLSEHGQRYAALARDLARAGFVVVAYDHRGHGAAACDPGYFAAQDGWEWVLSDLDCVRRYLAQQAPDLPLVLFGHSMGSFIARHYFVRFGQGLAGLVLSATGYQLGVLARVMAGVARGWGRVIGMRRPSKLLAVLVFGLFNLRFFPWRTPMEWLTRDRAEIERFLADPLCGAIPTPGLWADLFAGVARLEQEERQASNLPADCPVWLLAGSHDPVSLGRLGLAQLARCYQAHGLSDVEYQIYPGARHEMHHEINRQRFLQDLFHWLDRHYPANGAATLPSPS